jgi:hypothetical protein
MISARQRPLRFRRTAALALLGLALVLTACSGVPKTSAPSIVTPIGQVPVQSAVVSPPAGAEPRTIVTDFLQNNASSDPHHNQARAFLTQEQNNLWSDTTVTIVDDWQIGIPDAQNRITVTGNLVGTIDANGIYTPQQTIGGGGGSKPFTYTLKQVDGQWRIDNIQPNGLLINDSQFLQYYVSRTLYFYNTEQRLVPDPRFTSLRDSTDLENWLMAQLAQGARPSLQSITTPEFPNQTDPRRVTVTPGDIVKVEIPGASQLDSDRRGRLAAAVSLTLAAPLAGGDMTITDGGRPVDIPQVKSDVFNAASFAYAIASPQTPPDLYYVNPNGALINADTEEPIAGPLGTGTTYHFTSVGLANLSNTNTDRLLVAGTVGAPGQQTLYVGATSGALHQVGGIYGALSRPAWVPSSNEVWVGAGSSLYRISTSGPHADVAQPVMLGTDKAASDVMALRFSPEGSRVALVLRNGAGQGQIWLGSVVRTTDSVQVSDLALISPAGVSISDVAWNDSLKLFAVGHNLSGALAANVYELQSDGSLWTAHGIPGLPGEPDSITVAEHVVAAVSAARAVWVQSRGGSTWVPPAGGTAQGTNPIYVE